MMTSLSGLAHENIAPAPKFVNEQFEMCTSAYTAITAESWFVSLPIQVQPFILSKVLGIAMTAHTLLFMFLGSDFKVISHDCKMTPPE